jgi:DNA (cytosine-5)-methyltransferase 1
MLPPLMMPDFDIMLAGFPCQHFSNAGQRKGVDDKRGTLFEEYERLLTIGKERKKTANCLRF